MCRLHLLNRNPKQKSQSRQPQKSQPQKSQSTAEEPNTAAEEPTVPSWMSVFQDVSTPPLVKIFMKVLDNADERDGSCYLFRDKMHDGTAHYWSSVNSLARLLAKRKRHRSENATSNMGDTVCMSAHAQMLANKAYAAIRAIGQGILNSPDHIIILRIFSVCI